MCGRYTLKTSPQQLMSLFQVPLLPEIAPRYNIAPTQQVLVFRAGMRRTRGTRGSFGAGIQWRLPRQKLRGQRGRRH